MQPCLMPQSTRTRHRPLSRRVNPVRLLGHPRPAGPACARDDLLPALHPTCPFRWALRFPCARPPRHSFPLVPDTRSLLVGGRLPKRPVTLEFIDKFFCACAVRQRASVSGSCFLLLRDGARYLLVPVTLSGEDNSDTPALMGELLTIQPNVLSWHISGDVLRGYPITDVAWASRSVFI